MKWMIASFSPTGTTKKIAKAITEGTGCSVLDVDLTDLEAVKNVARLDDTAVLLAAVPVYQGRVPAVALERLKGIRGNGRYAVAVVVYGNREYEDALLELKNTLEESGFQVAAAAAFVAEHSIIRSIASGRPDEADIRTAKKFGADILEKINGAQNISPVTVPGNVPYRAVNAPSAWPAADDACNRCGACAAACPVGAISRETPNLTSGDKCINCMRCIQVCPRKARSMPARFLEGAKTMLEKNAAKRREAELFL